MKFKTICANKKIICRLINEFFVTTNTIPIALFFALLFIFNAGISFAQSFNQTGKIRAVVSETETKASLRENSFYNFGNKFVGSTKSKTDFYFTYTISENGRLTEKWTALSDERDWSSFSNRTVRIGGDFENNKLSIISVSPLAEMSKEDLLNPPPTSGLYKTIAVPLTIQPTQASENSGENNLTVTPEQIRNNFFNAPNSVNNFYAEASYGAFGFTGVHHPQIDVVPMTIQATISSDCQGQIVTEFTPIVRQRLLEQNIDTNSGGVDLGIIIFNDVAGCPPYPFATRGALGVRGVPLWVWMPESWFVTGVSILTHEIGHALGGNHPVYMRCSDFDNPQTCVYGEADDRTFMTAAGRFNYLPSNYERRRWGWHPAGAFDTPANALFQTLDLQSPALLFLKDGAKKRRFYFKNLSGTNAAYSVYPEARRSWGQFERYAEADESFHSGISVRIGHGDYGHPEALTFLLDPNNTADVGDAPLSENEQVSIGGILIKCERNHNPMWGTRMKVQ